MFTAKFNENESCTKVYGLWQWSFGQKLKIVGVPVSEHTIEVHFSEEGNEEALRVLANVEDGAIISDIPNELLRSGRNLFAYVYFANETEGATVRKVNMFVRPRAKPRDYSAPEDRDMLQQILAIAKGKADDLILRGKMLQLASEGKEIGNEVELPAGTGEVESLTDAEIDKIMEGE